MPSKPTWYGRLDQILADIRTLPDPWVDRQTVQRVLQVGPRRAQQILQSCFSTRVGNRGLVSQEHFVAHLHSLTAQDGVLYEQRRRQKFAETVQGWRRDRLQQPQVLVEAPSSIINQQFEDLPPGITLGHGMIAVRFETCQDALEKLLALAMAIGRDFAEFERLTCP